MKNKEGFTDTQTQTTQSPECEPLHHGPIFDILFLPQRYLVSVQ